MSAMWLARAKLRDRADVASSLCFGLLLRCIYQRLFILLLHIVTQDLLSKGFFLATLELDPLLGWSTLMIFMKPLALVLLRIP